MFLEKLLSHSCNIDLEHCIELFDAYIFLGALERQAKLRDMGVQNLLQELLRTSDQTLYDK